MRVLAQRGMYVVEVPESVSIGDLITLTEDEYGRAENIQIGQPYKKARKDARVTAYFQSRLMPKQYGMAGIFRVNQVDV